jgi:hypothetical protein
VQEHPADRDNDERHIDEPDGVDQWKTSVRIDHVYGTDGKPLSRSRVTLTAGGGQVRRMDVRPSIGGREYIVNTMTGGTARNALSARSRDEPVVAVLIGMNLV